MYSYQDYLIQAAYLVLCGNDLADVATNYAVRLDDIKAEVDVILRSDGKCPVGAPFYVVPDGWKCVDNEHEREYNNP